MANYVEPEEFYKEVCNYLEELKINPEARISEKLGRMILKTVEGYASLGQFRNYTFNEDLIQMACLYVCKYLKNYKVEFKNPHSWITQVAWSAFIQTINKEHRHLYTRFKTQFKNNSVSNLENSSGDEIQMTNSVDFSRASEFVQNFERKLEEKSKKKIKNENLQL